MRRFIRLIILIKTYTRTALSLRGAQSATRQSPGREDGRLVHDCPKHLPREGGYPLPDPSSVATRQVPRGGSLKGTRPSKYMPVAVRYPAVVHRPWRISPLRSDYRPHSGRNDSIIRAGGRGTPLQIGQNDGITANAFPLGGATRWCETP